MNWTYNELYDHFKRRRGRQLEYLDRLIMIRVHTNRAWEDLKTRKLALLRRCAVAANRIVINAYRREVH